MEMFDLRDKELKYAKESLQKIRTKFYEVKL